MLNFDCGIYTITSPSGKQYVGSALSFKKRWREHRRELQRGVHHCRALQRAFDKYGGKLVFAKVAIVPREDLLKREQEQIDARTVSGLYNSNPTAGSALGAKRSAETRAKLSVSALKRPKRTISLEHVAKLVAGKRAAGVSPETRAKISAANKGKTLTPETRAKISAAQVGKQLSAERVEFMRAFHTGRKRPAATSERMSRAKNGVARAQNTSGYCGVVKAGGRWRACITVSGRRVHLGYFDSPEAANDAIIATRTANKA